MIKFLQPVAKFSQDLFFSPEQWYDSFIIQTETCLSNTPLSYDQLSNDLNVVFAKLRLHTLMPVFRLSDQITFPPIHLAEDNGLLAIGGDLRPDRLISAYSHGVFPWFSKGDPILWWCTSPRLVIFLNEFRIPKRLARYIKNTDITITRNAAFTETIKECAAIRTETGDETWILPEMQSAYVDLYDLGYAHSFECWQQNQLVGGLYGIALDKVFFGESMFSRVKCGSQFALVALVEFLKSKNFTLIDCQMTTSHLLRFGAREINRREFQLHLKKNIKNMSPKNNWNYEKNIHT